MNKLSGGEVTRLLRAWNLGSDSALEELLPLVYDELHRLARIYIRRERPGHLLQTTALMNEAYMRLAEANELNLENRSHLLGITARLMRQVLVDYARSRDRGKRGGGMRQVSLADNLPCPDQTNSRILDLDEALTSLGKFYDRKAKVVELRYFGGFSVEETARALAISKETVMRDWRFAKAWLLKRLEKE